ncbi:Hsp70 family protein [Dactylosporangium sp. CA-139066]|uniref:Hsp70 family protein n=1 Tax=Dactylosporangium sp. CA-139066 TaxID=3239930 RepID=UPI003D8F0BBA
MPFRFAVDLGTSNTVAVVDRGDGTPRPLLFDGSPLLPSAVFADPGGALLVGRDAERHMMTDATRFEPNPKGRIDDGAILLGDRELPVAELLAAVLRRAAAEAAQTGVPVAGATVLTCPVDWGNTRRAVLLEAAGRAGLGRVALLDEPVSAATYCARALGGRLAPGRCAAVFDFGGGTLDVTVVEATPPGGGAAFDGRGPVVGADDGGMGGNYGGGGAADGGAGLRVLATGGLADLGGTDIDAALVGHLGHLIAAADADLWRRLAAPRTPAEFRDRRTFWSEVRQAKEMLSRSASAPIHVPGSDRATHLTREELERIAGPLVDRAVDETRRVLERSGVTPARLDAIVLVGGSSRLPLVASRLHARFGLAPVVPEQPELPVAFGALLLANGPSTSTSTYASPPTGDHPATPAGGYPSGPVSAIPSAPVIAQPAAAYAAPVAFQPPYPQPGPQGHAGLAARAPVTQPERRARPSVIIGPGVTIQGNVAVYGDADLMPPDEDDEPRSAASGRAGNEPAPEPKRRRRGVLRRLRFAALPIVPWVLIMVLTPWGRGLLHDGKDKVDSLFGGSAQPSAPASAPGSPSPSASRAAAGPATLLLVPASGKAGAPVKLTAGGFGAGERIDVKADNRTVTTLTADDHGAVEESVTVAAGGTKTGKIVNVQLVGKTSRLSATAQYRVAS